MQSTTRRKPHVGSTHSSTEKTPSRTTHLMIFSVIVSVIVVVFVMFTSINFLHEELPRVIGGSSTKADSRTKNHAFADFKRRIEKNRNARHHPHNEHNDDDAHSHNEEIKEERDESLFGSRKNRKRSRKHHNTNEERDNNNNEDEDDQPRLQSVGKRNQQNGAGGGFLSWLKRATVGGAAGEESSAGTEHHQNNNDNNNNQNGNSNNQNNNNNNNLFNRTHYQKYFAQSPNNGQFRGDCERVAGEGPLAQAWLETKREACFVSNARLREQQKLPRVASDIGDTRVEEHLIDYIDGKPSFRFYENVFLSSYAGDMLGNGCSVSGTYLVGADGKRIDGRSLGWTKPVDKEMLSALEDPKYLAWKMNRSKSKKQNDDRLALLSHQQHKNSVSDDHEQEMKDNLNKQLVAVALSSGNNKPLQIERFGYDDEDLVLVRLVRFHLGNPYEAFHSYINTYLMLKAFGFNQTKVQFAFEDKQESCLRDDQFWNSFTLGQRPPIYRFTGNDGLGHTRRKDNPHQPVLARVAIQGFSTGISVITTGTPPLGGRAKDHYCSSSLAQNSIKWMRSNFVKLGMLPPHPIQRTPYPRIEVIWESRQVHTRAGGKLLLPHRMMARETQFVLALREALGPDFRLRVVDFGRLDGPESIAAVESAQVLIGCHGAGLTFGMFMKPSQSAIVEIFGGNRPSSNKHYNNIAKLMDFNYKSLTIGSSYEGAYDWYVNVEGERRAFSWDHGFVRSIADTVHSFPWVEKLRRRRLCDDQ